MLTSLGLAFLAGILSLLSPCVLPLLPLVLGAAATEHRLGPVALAAGLALSFVVIGLFVATIGFAIGLDGAVFRIGGAIMLVAIGLVLMVPAAQERVAVMAGPMSHWTESRFGGFSAVSSASDCCLERSGAPASARRSGQPRCSLRKAETSVRSR